MPKVILVTGGSRGIGAAVARRAAKDGYAVCITYASSGDRADALAAEICANGGIACPVFADVAEEVDVLRLFGEIDRRFGRLDCLVNSAGVTGGFATIKTVSAEQIDRTFAVNVRGTILCCREAIRRMSPEFGGQGGVIVNISSTAARTGGSGEWVHYAASKAAVSAYTTGASREVAAEGIRIVAVAPGLVATDLHNTNGDPDRPRRLSSTVPMERVGQPEEIAEAVSWIMSPAASYVTGAVLDVSGGR